MENAKRIFEVCDIVTVTTDALADYYIKKFGVEKNKIYKVPNYLPRWWVANKYNEEKISKRFDSLSERKPRLGFVSSTTHFDIFNRNGGVDDFTHVNSFVRDNVDKYDFIFIGGVPQQLHDLMKDNKITYIKGFDILNYPTELLKLDIDIVIAPLQDNVFNRCKSNIKFLEMGGLGIPCICQNLEPYRKYTDTLFDDEDDLSNMVDNLLGSKERYMDNVKLNHDIVYNGNEIKSGGWLLEDNINDWIKLYCINQKTLEFDVTQMVENSDSPLTSDGQLFEA